LIVGVGETGQCRQHRDRGAAEKLFHHCAEADRR
jgi:hypothetical protein